ncbi:MAG TPA: DNA gyrase inhibitor YacG [Bryobacteraceae bacterium]|jgi:endogenous inhibitor of DNA gyrase (YacG/DUF329 family)|nr:DNA gyrase inhibitor YacG [Bryobacteraceae bacterium]
MKCPICKKEVDKSNPEMPFCSDRCRLLDLGAWADEKYVISTPLQPQEIPEDDSKFKE